MHIHRLGTQIKRDDLETDWCLISGSVDKLGVRRVCLSRPDYLLDPNTLKIGMVLLKHKHPVWNIALIGRRSQMDTSVTILQTVFPWLVLNIAARSSGRFARRSAVFLVCWLCLNCGRSDKRERSSGMGQCLMECKICGADDNFSWPQWKASPSNVNKRTKNWPNSEPVVLMRCSQATCFRLWKVNKPHGELYDQI